jgi:hypothetical protein
VSAPESQAEVVAIKDSLERVRTTVSFSFSIYIEYLHLSFDFPHRLRPLNECRAVIVCVEVAGLTDLHFDRRRGGFLTADGRRSGIVSRDLLAPGK